MTRKRSDPHTFEQRLHEQKLRLERKLGALPIGKQRDDLMARIEQLQSAAEMFEFLSVREPAVPVR